MGQQRRLARLNADYSDATIITDRMYNMILCGTVLYGVLVNILLCKLVGNVYNYVNPIVFILAYFFLCIAGIAVARSTNPAMSFLGYNMIVVPVGLVISTAVECYGGISSSVVLYAFYYTALITAIMTCLAILYPQIFAQLGGFLFAGLIGILIVGLFSRFLGSTGYYYYSIFAAAIFSLYIGYDIYRSQQFEKTVDNAIDCAIDVYLDIANLFLRLLEILSARRRD